MLWLRPGARGRYCRHLSGIFLPGPRPAINGNSGPIWIERIAFIHLHVEAVGVDDLEKVAHELPDGNSVGVEGSADTLGVAIVFALMLLEAGGGSVGPARLGGGHAGQVPEELLYTPKAAAGEKNFFSPKGTLFLHTTV